MPEGFPRKFGKYELLQPLAQGGMGVLYLAMTGERGLEKLSVIKTVLPHLADAEYVARFRDEAKVVVKLSHGNLVPVFDAGQVGGELFLAMDFVEGKDLRAVWNRCAKKQVAFPVDIAVHIVKELCRGLAYAHSFAGLELVHRDVSPPNVLISFAGEVKLTDFGLASSTLKLEKTAPGVIYGKVSYMSPEQARGEELDSRTDLYAAGIVLWELLTGRQLFPPPGGQKGNQAQELMARARDPHAEPPSKRAPRVPMALDEIVLKALAADPKDRFQNGEAMRTALAEWLAKEAPTTDAARLGKFVTELFSEDLAKERAERDALIRKVRQRPRMESARVEAPVPKSPARAALPERRSASTHKGVVPVPPPAPGGATIVHGHDSSGVVAALAPQLDSAESSGDVIGRIIDGRYRVRALIGEGGMGRVYEAEHVEIGKRVALKILHPVYSRSPDLVARFRREARAASKIGHPNIVDVTDSGTTDDGSVYFVMEFLEGVELASVIRREGALDIHRALNVGAQICRALAAAHNAGIIHRDLKPENIFLVVREGTTDFPKVLDFGIAKSAELEDTRAERLTHPGMAMGTPEYMAPEQAAGKPADARSDVYAVGAILYEMVTGLPPYDGENFMEILTKKATRDPRHPKELRPDLPDAVGNLVMKALARDPAARPRSMEALEYELTKCLAGRGVAVAKVLGMPVDADQGAPKAPVAPAPRAPPPNGLPAQSPPDVPGPWPAGVSDLSDVTDVISLRRSSRSAWLFFLLLVVASGATIVYYNVVREPRASNVVAVGQAGATAPVPSGASPDAQHEKAPDRAQPPRAAPRLDVAPASTPAPDKAGRPRPTVPGRSEEAALRSSGPTSPDRVERIHQLARPDGLPRDAREAEDLLALANAAGAGLRWAEARALYDRVARGKYRRTDGLVGLARIAWQTRDIDTAMRHAKQALEAGGGDPARLILGHSYYKKGRYPEAVQMYKTVLKNDPANREAKSALRDAETQVPNR